MIALDVLSCIDEERGRASKWSLIKILGNESQFHCWVEDFFVAGGFVEEKMESNRSIFSKTESGELFHQLLKNGNLMQALLKVSGKRLRRY